MNITIKDIAQLAGVSRGTVDRAINNRGHVAPDIKEKILQIAKEHGYKKNVIASRLAKKDPIKIAIVLPDPSHDLFWDGPMAGIVKMEKFMLDYGIRLNYHLFDGLDSMSYCNALDTAIKERPKAIMAAPLFYKESLTYFQIALQNEIPFLCINSEIEHEDILCYIGQDSFQSGLLAGKLFDLHKSDKKKILALTLGHDSKNAIHINKKLSGLDDYNIRHQCDFEILNVAIENFQSKNVLKSFAEEMNHLLADIRGFFFTNSRAYHFINNTGLFDVKQNDLICIGYDLVPENIKLLEEGKIDYLLNQNAQKQGYLGIMNLFNYFIYKKEIPRKQYLSTDVIFKENYVHYLEDKEMNLELVI